MKFLIGLLIIVLGMALFNFTDLNNITAGGISGILWAIGILVIFL
jgi:hypothetical protein